VDQEKSGGFRALNGPLKGSKIEKKKGVNEPVPGLFGKKTKERGNPIAKKGPPTKIISKVKGEKSGRCGRNKRISLKGGYETTS